MQDFNQDFNAKAADDVDEDMPTAMESEVYVNGKLHVNGTHKLKGKKGGLKKDGKKKKDDTNCSAVCGIFGSKFD